MGATVSIPDSVNVDEIISSNGLSRKQVCSLWTRFNELDCDGRGEIKGYKGYLDADDLSRIPKFEENPIAPRLIKVIFNEFGTNGKLTFRQFVDFMSAFAQRGRSNSIHTRRTSIQAAASTATKTDLESLKISPTDSAKTRKVKFIFRMYDVDHDGRLSKEDIQEILKMMVGKISDDEASMIAERVIGEFTDNQNSSTVSLENFEKSLETLDFNEKMSLKLLK